MTHHSFKFLYYQIGTFQYGLQNRDSSLKEKHISPSQPIDGNRKLDFGQHATACKTERHIIFDRENNKNNIYGNIYDNRTESVL